MHARFARLEASSTAALRGLLSAWLLTIPAAVATSQTEVWTRGTGLPDYYYVQALALDPRNPSTIWAGGALGRPGFGLFRSEDGGVSWLAIEGVGAPGEVQTIAVDPANGSTIYTGLNDVHHSDDGGAHWTSFSAPGLERGWFGYGKVNALAIDPHTPGRLWAATSEGLSRSDDGGQTWKAPSVAQEVYAILFDDRRPGTIYASSYDHEYEVESSYYPYPYTARAGGRIYSSTDGGTSWVWRQLDDSIVSLAVDPFEDGVVYAGSLRAVHRSADHGATWESWSEPAPDTWVFEIVPDPVRRNRLYAATGEGVDRSVDGGRTWSSLSEGLPQGETQGLVISPDGRRLHVGTNEGVFDLDLEAACRPSEEQLCLMGRYAVWLVAGRRGETPSHPGAARSLSDRSGYFALPFATGDPDFPEVVVKMLPDGAFGTGGAPVFYSSLTTLPYVLTVTDTLTGLQQVYAGNSGAPLCGGTDLAFLAADAFLSPRSAGAPEAALALLGSRFSVSLEARHASSGRTASGVVISSGDRFGFFSLPDFTGDPQFPEVVVKMVDFRAVSGKFWFFYTGLTSLDYTLTVTDSVTGATRIYESAGDFCGGADVHAFTN